MISFIIINSELLNGNWHWFNGVYDPFDDNVIKISRPKYSDKTKFSLHSFGNLNQGCRDTWLLNMTITEHIVCLSACTIEGIAQFPTWLHREHEQHWNNQQTRKLTYQYHWKVCCSSISVKMGGTSSSIPHRLNNGSWSTSFLHIKNDAPHGSLNELLKENSQFPVKVNILKLLALFTALTCCREEWGKEQ